MPDDVVAKYDEVFVIREANTEALKKETFKIRYRVFCEEMGALSPLSFPDFMEENPDDGHSVHFLLQLRATGEPVGCVRLITSENNRYQLPFRKAVGLDILPEFRKLLPDIPVEISRVSVLESFRNAHGHEPLALDPAVATMSALSLYLAPVAYCVEHDIPYGAAMMESELARRLRFMGIPTVQMGKVIDFYGPRAPYLLERDQILDNLKPVARGLLEAVNTQLREAPREPEMVGVRVLANRTRANSR